MSELPIAVVGSGPHGDKGFIEHVLVAFHDELMGSADQVDIICLIELQKIRSEGMREKCISSCVVKMLNYKECNTCATTSPPKRYPAPRGLRPHPSISVVGIKTAELALKSEILWDSGEDLFYLLDLTTINHTLALREEPLVFCQ